MAAYPQYYIVYFAVSSTLQARADPETCPNLDVLNNIRRGKNLIYGFLRAARRSPGP